MRISDWSSDVCSSDLVFHRTGGFRADNLAPGAPDQAIYIYERPGELLHAPVDPAIAQVTVLVGHGRRHRIDQRLDEKAGVVLFLACLMLELPGVVELDHDQADAGKHVGERSEENTYALQSLMSRSYAVFFLKKQ